MEYLLSLSWGMIQGLTEFLPISSSAHLLLVSQFFEFEKSFEAYVLLNIGTLAALIFFLRGILKSILQDLKQGDWQLVLKIVISTLPAGLLGFWLIDFINNLSSYWVILILMLSLGGILMLFTTPPKVKVADLSAISWRQTLLIASAQALALIPGTSRSGATILTGLWLGFKKDLAVKWSFLLALPLISGAVLRVWLSPSGWELIEQGWLLILIGNLVAFGIGLITIHFLIKIVETRSLKIFGIYRLVLAGSLLILLNLNIL
ncbi:MAG: undecaprenyl-diphosphate phosphatase [Candidatus Saccharibacteria bacterium]|nr:undecaprenyl-diphosphate phosphatase [Candidatus Saccharibacteria bacterium]